jgi:hypothetical protein
MRPPPEKSAATSGPLRLLLTALLVALVLAGFEPGVSAAQDAANRWTEPKGEFTVQWQAPWAAHRQEAELLAVTNGSTVAVATISLPVSNVNPSLCLDAYVAAAASPEVAATTPFMEGKTSWRAYAAYDNLAIGAVDYFECQVTPDGQSFAVFAGGTTLMEKYGNIPMLIDFLGQWVVRSDGEAAPAVADDGWRLAVVDWVRGSLYADLGLTNAPAGSEYLVVVADIANWQAAQVELPLASIAVTTGAASAHIPVNLEDSRRAAEALGEVPVEDAIAIEPGATRRVVLAFQVSGDAAELGLALGESTTALVDDGVPARLVVLPPPGALPALQTGTVANVIDGRTLLITMADTGQSERVRLIGLGTPEGEDASALLAGYIGQAVQLEGDPAHPDDQRLQRYVWATDGTGLPVLVNGLLIEQGLVPYESTGDAGRFDAMLAAVGAPTVPAADVGSAGASLPAADATSPDELTEADLAYLSELLWYRDNLALGLDYYDMFAGTPTLDAEFFGHLGIAVLGWAVFYDGVATLEPTPRFAELHARLLAAFEPFDMLAHQIEPELDLVLAGGAPQQQFSGFDYDLMTSTVASARPALEDVLAEIDAVLAAAGIAPESGITQ